MNVNYTIEVFQALLASSVSVNDTYPIPVGSLFFWDTAILPIPDGFVALDGTTRNKSEHPTFYDMTQGRWGETETTFTLANAPGWIQAIDNLSITVVA